MLTKYFKPYDQIRWNIGNDNLMMLRDYFKQKLPYKDYYDFLMSHMASEISDGSYYIFEKDYVFMMYLYNKYNYLWRYLK